MLVLPSGERLSGTHLKTEDGVVFFETKYLGTVQGREDEVEVLAEELDEVAYEFVMPGLVWQPMTNEPVSLKAPHNPADEAEEAVPAEEEGPKGIRAWTAHIIPEGWKGKANVGFSQLRTDAEVEKLDFSAKASKKVDDDEYIVQANYNYGNQTSSTGEESKNIDRYGGSFRWLNQFAEHFSTDLRSIYSKDLLRNVDHSVTQSAGVGYQYNQIEDLKFSVTPAVSGLYVEADEFQQHWIALATIYQEIVYKINDTLRIEQEGSYNYNPKQAIEYSYDVEAGIVAAVSDWAEAAVLYQNSFDNIVGEGGDKNEDRIVFQLGVPF
ncbi:DUF481 domain-containing protein [Rubellicoccus peritrichatus]|uniref:DUF481 domain-containing protein n=1 Tax=Rubellicoccus peritrichatus TaxID=3080537 RepID=A0AAQ3LC20_9BACT|nr:DUF481 domain-containing protein [Puniceicoccus sp. CR14]WOO42552.1 DUF481 domain-containing protein [Puniceicoccus sp. CR14]